MTLVSRILLVSVVLVAALNIYGAVQPVHAAWGFHLFAFAPSWMGILSLLVAGATLVPSVRKSVWHRMETFGRRLAGFDIRVQIALSGIVLVILMLLLPSRLHLLGDGALLLRVTGGLKSMEELPPNFNHQPLVGVIFRLIREFASSGLTDTAVIFRLLDGVAAILFVILLAYVFRAMKRPPAEVMTMGGLALLTAGSQFFLGYVELYVFFYLFTFAFLFTGWLAIEGKVPVLIPVACYLLMVGLHYGSLFFLPALAGLLVIVLRNRKRELFVMAGALLLIAVVAYVTGIFRPENLILRTVEESRYNFLPLSSGQEYFPYTMFSWNHLVDWANALLLVAPFGLPVVLAVVLALRRELSLTDPLLLFLGIAALAGLTFTFVMNPALGMARDWDFLASFFVPLIVLDIYLVRKCAQHITAHDLFVPVLASQLMLTSAWVAINANDARHLARVESLGDPAFLGVVPRMNYYETLANYYWYSGRPGESLTFWERYTAIDASNPRTLANLSEVYRKLGENEQAFQTLRRAAENNSRNAAVYMNLGVMYANRGDTARAIALNLQALAQDSGYAKAHANLGLLYSRQSRFSDAVVHLERAVGLGLQEPFLYRELGSGHFFLQNYRRALDYYDLYLQYAPGDGAVRDVRDRLERFIRETTVP